MSVVPAPSGSAECRLLAFDTSTEQMNLALVTPGSLLSVDLPGGSLASARLLPEIQALLQRAGCSLRELDAIAYGCGPGAFTGLRTACAVAQGLAFGIDRPVLPVDSLMLVAETVGDALMQAGQDQVFVAQDARMDEVYAATYRWQGAAEAGGDRWQVVQPPALYGIDALELAWRQAVGTGGAAPVVVGSALEVHADRLALPGARRLGPADAGSRAEALARLARCAWHSGQARDASLALPVYLRDKVALTTAERDAVRAAQQAAA